MPDKVAFERITLITAITGKTKPLYLPLQLRLLLQRINVHVCGNTGVLHLHYAFSRRFYPKRLTVHSDHTFIASMCVPWE